MSKPSLDELIAQTERSLLAREARLGRHTSEAGDRLKRMTPWVLGGGLAVFMGTALLSRWIRPPVPALNAQRQDNRAAAAQRDAPWWTRWLVLVWPLVPAGVRQRLGPGEGLPLVALGLKLRQLLVTLASRRVAPVAAKAGTPTAAAAQAAQAADRAADAANAAAHAAAARATELAP